MSNQCRVIGCTNDSLSYAAAGALNTLFDATALTAGWPDAARKGLVIGRCGLYPNYNVKFVNWGYSAQNMQHALNSATALKALVNSSYQAGGGRPAFSYVMYVQIGTNPDTGVAATDAARMRGFCLDMQSVGIAVVLCAVPAKTGQDTLNQALNAIYGTWGTSDGIYSFIPPTVSELYATGAAANTTYFSDGVHPTATGYNLLKNHISPYITAAVQAVSGIAPHYAP